MEVDFNKIQEDVKRNREELIDRLVNFSLNDVLLFWSSDDKLLAEQKAKWTPVLSWVNNAVNARFYTTSGLDVPKENQDTAMRLKKYIDSFSDKELTAFYIAALNMRSVLLALAMVKGKISADEAFELSELEELYQARKWGNEPVAEARRNSIKDTLLNAESYLLN